MKRLVLFAIVGAAALVFSSPAALATDITNPADHPFPITVTVYGQTYHDGQDTLPGYDDYECTAIPGVTYDFAANKIEYSNGKVASWTEWDRIPGYEVWVQQQKQKKQQSQSQQQTQTQQQQAQQQQQETSSGSNASVSTSSGSGSAATTRGGKSSGSFAVIKSRVSRVSGAFTVKPTSTKPGKLKVIVATRAGSAGPTGTVVVRAKHGQTVKTLRGHLSNGTVTAAVPRLAKGTWSIAITWPGDANYLAASGRASLAVIR